MDARQIIMSLRDKKTLSPAEMDWFAQGLAGGDVSDAQAGAFAMAVCLNGVSTDEKVALTLAMRDSGKVLGWDLPGPVLDKHSTGGIGDCVSLLLAPALAALGAYVPMVSGRGLGHTGGTLDKLEAIPGLNTEVTEEQFRQMVANTGAAIVSATGDIAPADKRLYAVRDVTGTVESIDLITASILSKKLAAGLETLILDVKVGSGAFMKTPQDAEALARSLVETANNAGCRTAALITDMNQPCTPSVGNALEVAATMEVLCGENPDNRLAGLTAELGGELLALSGLSEDAKSGADKIFGTFSDGSAADRFGRMVADLGGPVDFVEKWRDQLPRAAVVQDVPANGEGYVAAMGGEKLGLAVVHLGGGRLRGGDRIEPSVGLSNVASIGDRITAETPLARVHAMDKAAADAATISVRNAFILSDSPPEPTSIVYKRIS